MTPPTQEGEVRLVTRPKKGEGEERRETELLAKGRGRGRIAHSFIWVRKAKDRISRMSRNSSAEDEEGWLTLIK